MSSTLRSSRSDWELEMAGIVGPFDGWKAWADFVNTEDLHDDACLVLLATHPPDSLETICTPGSCKHARRFVEAWSLLAGFSDLDRGQIVLAVDGAVRWAVVSQRSAPMR